MKKILVTGGAGYIGIHTVYSLLEAGYFVIILDSLKNSSYEAINNLGRLVKDKIPDRFENIEFFKGDIRDNFILNDIFAKNKKSGKSINGVIHFAGLKSVPQSLKNPTKYWDVNVCGTINLIKVMDLYDCRK